MSSFRVQRKYQHDNINTLREFENIINAINRMQEPADFQKIAENKAGFKNILPHSLGNQVSVIHGEVYLAEVPFDHTDVTNTTKELFELPQKYILDEVIVKPSIAFPSGVDIEIGDGDVNTVIAPGTVDLTLAKPHVEYLYRKYENGTKFTAFFDGAASSGEGVIIFKLIKIV